MTGQRTAPTRLAPEPGSERLHAYVGEQLYGPQGPQGPIEPADVGTDNPPPEVRATRSAAIAAQPEEGNSDMTDEQYTPEQQAEWEAALEAQQARQAGGGAEGVPLTAQEQTAFDAFELDDEAVAAFNALTADEQQAALDEMVARFEAGEVGAAEPRDGSPEAAFARKQLTPESWEAHLEKVRKSGRYLGHG